jgi:hypothetical protein
LADLSIPDNVQPRPMIISVQNMGSQIAGAVRMQCGQSAPQRKPQGHSMCVFFRKYRSFFLTRGEGAIKVCVPHDSLRAEISTDGVISDQ